MSFFSDPSARDFSTDRRLLVLGALAPVIGSAGAGAAWLLLQLINLATNIAYFGRFSTQPVSIGDNRSFTVGFEDEPAARLADRMLADDSGRAPVLRRSDGALVGLVARRDLLTIRARLRSAEQEREALIPVRVREAAATRRRAV